MQNQTFYRDILKKSYNITFKNKAFWLLGLFSAPLIGMGEYQMIAHGFGFFSQDWLIAKWYPIVNTGVFQFNTLHYLAGQLFTNPLSLLLLLAILAVLILLLFFIIWLAVVSQGSLIDGIDKTSAKRLTSPKLAQFITTGVARFFPILTIHIFVKLIITALSLLLTLPIIAISVGGNSQLGGLFYLIFCITFIPLAIILSFISKYAINYIVIEKEKVSDGIKKAAKLFADNWLATIEMSIILILIAFLSGLVIAAIISLAIIPIGLFVYVLAQMGATLLVKAILILTISIFIIIVLLFAAILSTFQYCGWVLFFKELTSGEKKVLSKLARLLNI